ncbi:hypothetical protein Anacy_1352 [Anabaena cylindrica PCC 7122]|uniref:Uncharacterized protein n=1 Tax=Anabaena cylindrica (strain ATCC 27899 / PCC 7122) TaxID=272123 RepID=K9ZCB8_ANACC|nr:hypothetical protein Anacy_1352 [Anabaena cylindrica PCC 7122]BAY06177.1 hypothetical protein NIES19_54600 [Anabaena cylindrica PCC 7122]
MPLHLLVIDKLPYIQIHFHHLQLETTQSSGGNGYEPAKQS